MKKLLLASTLAIASIPGFAHAADTVLERRERGCETMYQRNTPEYETCLADDQELPAGPRPPARVTVAPSYQGPPPIGWVYAPYIQCPDKPGLYGLLGLYCPLVVVTVPAAGLNIRTVPNGPAVMALVNGTPLYPVRQEGPWLLIAPACDLTPTWAWSWNAGVPLNRCWVYF